MSDLPQEPSALADMLDRLEFSDEIVTPPPVPDGDVMAVRSIRWSADFDGRVKAAAKQRGVSVSQLVRDLVELELAAMENDQPISRADALRALASLRPLGGAA
jgi:predicted DNA-binding protein